MKIKNFLFLKRQEQHNNTNSADMSKGGFILYVAPQKGAAAANQQGRRAGQGLCKGSTQCIRVIDSCAALKKEVRIQDVGGAASEAHSHASRAEGANGAAGAVGGAATTASALPVWLKGTPTLVDVAEKQVFYGSDALNELRERAIELTERAQPTEPKGGNGGNGGKGGGALAGLAGLSHEGTPAGFLVPGDGPDPDTDLPVPISEDGPIKRFDDLSLNALAEKRAAQVSASGAR